MTWVDPILRLWKESPRYVLTVWAISGLLLLPQRWLHHLSIDAFALQNRHWAILGFVASSVVLLAYPVNHLWKGIEKRLHFISERNRLGKSFEVIGIRQIGGTVGAPNGLLYENDSNSPQLLLGVVGFRNRSNVSRKLESTTAIAQISYRDHRGKEIAYAPAGVWLGSYGQSAKFAPGHENWLVLFVCERGGLTRVWNRSFYTDTSWMSGGPSFAVEPETVPPNIASVKIGLLSEQIHCKEITVEVEMRRKGLPQLLLRTDYLGRFRLLRFHV